MLDGKRKSMQPMAVPWGGVNHQQLQQSVTSSTWYPRRCPARGSLIRRIHCVAGTSGHYFERDSNLDWRRHVILTSLAQAFCTQLRINPKRRLTPIRRTRRTPDPAQHLDRRLPHLPTTLPLDAKLHPTEPNLTKPY
jgi:hypothetical protein